MDDGSVKQLVGPTVSMSVVWKVKYLELQLDRDLAGGMES
jgi:hypothetical protein